MLTVCILDVRSPQNTSTELLQKWVQEICSCQLPPAGVNTASLPAGLNIRSNAGTSLGAAASTLDTVITSGTRAASDIKRYGVTSLDNFEAKYKRRTDKVGPS